MKCSLLCCIPPGPAGISACCNRRPYFSQPFSAVHISSAALLQGCYYFYLALQPPTVHRKDFNQSFCFHIFPPSSTLSHCFSPLLVFLCRFVENRWQNTREAGMTKVKRSQQSIARVCLCLKKKRCRNELSKSNINFSSLKLSNLFCHPKLDSSWEF